MTEQQDSKCLMPEDWFMQLSTEERERSIKVWTDAWIKTSDEESLGGVKAKQDVAMNEESGYPEELKKAFEILSNIRAMGIPEPDIVVIHPTIWKRWGKYRKSAKSVIRRRLLNKRRMRARYGKRR